MHCTTTEPLAPSSFVPSCVLSTLVKSPLTVKFSRIITLAVIPYWPSGTFYLITFHTITSSVFFLLPKLPNNSYSQRLSGHVANKLRIYGDRTPTSTVQNIALLTHSLHQRFFILWRVFQTFFSILSLQKSGVISYYQSLEGIGHFLNSFILGAMARSEPVPKSKNFSIVFYFLKNGISSNGSESSPPPQEKKLVQQSCARKAGFLYLLKQQFSFKHKY